MRAESLSAKPRAALTAVLCLAWAIGARAGGGSGIVPRGFIENLGQWPDCVTFCVHTDEMLVALERNGIRLRSANEAGAIRLTFEGASEAVALEGEKRQAATCSFFLGQDCSRWRTGVPLYTSVLYRGLYDCIDLRARFAGDRRIVEYDLYLEPGAELDHVVVRCDGVDGLATDIDGSLLLATERGVIRQSPPKTWQVRPSGERVHLACRYRLLDESRFGFEAPGAVPGLATVIDPEIVWLTYCGGNDGDAVYDVAVDDKGCTIVTGYTMSADFIEESGGAHRGGMDVFVARFDEEGSDMPWIAFLGGPGTDIGRRL